MAGHTFQLYANLVATIDGRLQNEQQALSIWNGIEKGRFKNRVTIQWAVPGAGLEFDGRPLIGTDRTVRLAIFVLRSRERLPPEVTIDWAARNPELARLDMRVVSFAMDTMVGREDHAHAVFECSSELPMGQFKYVVGDRVRRLGSEESLAFLLEHEREGVVQSVDEQWLHVMHADGGNGRFERDHCELVERRPPVVDLSAANAT